MPAITDVPRTLTLEKKKHHAPFLAAAARLALTGRVLGISGIAGGIARGQLDAPRVAFTAGLLGAGGALALPALFLPAAAASSSTTLLLALPAASYSASRAVAAGALVGVGSALGGGCTSGHGICGNARLSARSAAFTGVMMAAGAASAAASGARAAIGLSAAAAAASSAGPSGVVFAPYAAPAAGVVAYGLGLFAVAVGAFVLLALAGKRVSEGQETKRKKLVELAAEFSTGLCFALGLALSGMLRPAKVVAFLTPFGGRAGGGWDPSLPLVMGAALAVAVPAFQRVLPAVAKKDKTKKPACSSSFSLPTKTAVDARLLAGAAVFGAGWGLGGICPGPGLVAAAATGGGGLYLAWCAAFLAAHALTSSVAS